jgi:hypothetical protein
MRNMRSISIRMRNIVSSLGALLLLLLDIGLGELDKLFTFSIHPRVVLVFSLVANSTLDVRSSCIHICTSCILKLLLFNGLLLLVERLGFIGWLRRSLSDICSLLKLIQRIPTVILRRFHIILLHKFAYHLLKLLDL